MESSVLFERVDSKCIARYMHRRMVVCQLFVTSMLFHSRTKLTTKITEMLFQVALNTHDSIHRSIFQQSL